MTVGGDRAAGALGVRGIATGLSEADEVAVPGLPVADGQDLAELHLRFDRLLRVDELEPVADAVDMDVDADGGEVEADGDREVRGLASDTRKFAELLDRLREDAAELRLKDAGEFLEVTGLVPEEADGIDELLDLGDGEALEVGRGEPLPGRSGEEALHGACGAGVLGAGGEDRTDEHAEGVVGLRLDQFDDRRGMGLEFLLQGPVDGRDVFDGHGI